MRLVGGVRCKVTRNFPTYPPRVDGITNPALFGWDGHGILIWNKKCEYVQDSCDHVLELGYWNT